jgi:hypothetical protein
MRRLQFSLRTLLVAMLVLGMLPWIGLRYWKWRESEIWSAHNAAKVERDQALQAWRDVYDQFVNNQASATIEGQARARYFAARKTVEQKRKAIESLYGNSEDKLQRAMMARRQSAKP